MNNKSNYRQKNGKMGGRPRQDSIKHTFIPNINFVILTEPQYTLLIKKYGIDLLKNALQIFDNWLQSGSPHSLKYKGKNNYAHFRADGWVINEAKRIL